MEVWKCQGKLDHCAKRITPQQNFTEVNRHEKMQSQRE